MYNECENKNGTGATTMAKNESFFFFSAMGRRDRENPG